MSELSEIVNGLNANKGGETLNKEAKEDTDAVSGTASGLDKAQRRALRKRNHQVRAANYWNEEHHSYFASSLPDDADYDDHPPPRVVLTQFPDCQPVSNCFNVNLLACWMVKTGQLQESNIIKKQWMVSRYEDHCWRKTMEIRAAKAASGGIRKNSMMYHRKIAREASRLPEGGISQDDYLLVKHGKAKIVQSDGKYQVIPRGAYTAAAAAVIATSSTANALQIGRIDTIDSPFEVKTILGTSLMPSLYFSVDPIQCILAVMLFVMAYYLGHCLVIKHRNEKILRSVRAMESKRKYGSANASATPHTNGNS